MRFGSGAYQTALESGTSRPAMFLRLEKGSDTIRLWNGYAAITGPDGQTFSPLGPFGSISPPTSSAAGEVPRLDLELSGISPEIMAVVDLAWCRNADAIIWEAQMEPSGSAIAAYAQAFVGFVKTARRKDVPNARIILSVQGGPRILPGKGGSRRTHADQQRRVKGLVAPGWVDRFFESTQTAGQRQRYWGMKAPVRSGQNAGISGGGGRGQPPGNVDFV